MATTTPNYGWTVPTSTDLVKDGATAIETLGDAIDASMNTALGTKKAGMVLLNTTSFSAVASASLPANTFSSTYTNYRLIVNIDAASTDSQILTVRLRAAGTDATGSNYSWALVKNAYTTSGTFDGATQTSWIVGNSGVTNANFAFDLLQPFNAEPTNISGYAIQSSDIFFVAAKHTLSTSYDSATILIGSGTMTGSYSIFGYNK
jgi:hypothetical protein